jgi:hypothetical protein
VCYDAISDLSNACPLAISGDHALMLQEKILKELEQIPETKLAELYDLIHYYRIGLEHDRRENPTMQLAGAWADMPDDLFESFVTDIHHRRRQGLSHRRRQIGTI